MVKVGDGLGGGGVEVGDVLPEEDCGVVLPIEDFGDGLPGEGVVDGVADGEVLLCN